jgi:formylglycine-generating enzyme required for sulfatase activity
MAFLVMILPVIHATGQIQRGTVRPPKTETPKPAKPEIKKPKRTPGKPNRGRAQFGSHGRKPRTVIPGNGETFHHQEEEERQYEVTFRCNIDNATLFIDDYEEEDGPNSTVTFTQGEYQISVEADGYEPCDTVINVDRDGQVFDIILKEKDRPLPLLYDDIDEDWHLSSQSSKANSKPQTESQQPDESLTSQPATVETEPVVEEEQPVVDAGQPVVEDIEPVTENEQTVIKEEPTPTTPASTTSSQFDELFQQLDTHSELDTITVKGVSFTMVRVEGGTYTRYKIPENIEEIVEGDVYTGVPRAHNVTVSSFYIGTFEVTNDLWFAVMADSVVNDGGLYPYDNASWTQCQEFIAKLNKMTGRVFRLPTDAEWEFAARGGVKSQGYVFAGSNSIEDVAWYNGNSDIEYHDVGTKEPNELGIYDMSGSVPEWCADWFWYWPGVDETTPPLVNPIGEKYKDKRVYRGGGYGNEASDCCVFRYFNDNPDSGRGMGFRLAM